MSTPNLGNQLNQLVAGARAALFDQGELAQLTYSAFDNAVRSLQGVEQETIEVTFPVGYRADKTAMNSTRRYDKSQLFSKYQFLAQHQLSVNAVLQLVTIVEAMMGDVIRTVVIRYPHKLGAKRQIAISAVLESTTIEEVHVRATDGFLNDLGYKSPAEFSESFTQLLSVNLTECPAFHRYMEIKATRDIYVHNRGYANEIYLRKAGTHARVSRGAFLPADVPYFLESYEVCLQLTEWLEQQLHEHWHSSELEDRLAARSTPLLTPASPEVSAEMSISPDSAVPKANA